MEQKLGFGEALGNKNWLLAGPGLATTLPDFSHMMVNLMASDLVSSRTLRRHCHSGESLSLSL